MIVRAEQEETKRFVIEHEDGRKDSSGSQPDGWEGAVESARLYQLSDRITNLTVGSIIRAPSGVSWAQLRANHNDILEDIDLLPDVTVIAVDTPSNETYVKIGGTWRGPSSVVLSAAP